MTYSLYACCPSLWHYPAIKSLKFNEFASIYFKVATAKALPASMLTELKNLSSSILTSTLTVMVTIAIELALKTFTPRTIKVLVVWVILVFVLRAFRESYETIRFEVMVACVES